jgi:beta-lactamase superfamily II metal-dependent hydrolase
VSLRTIRRVFVRLALILCVSAPLSHAQSTSGWSGAWSKRVSVDFLDVGQGDSILIHSPEDKTALVDAGPTKEGAVRTLKRRGIKSIDLVIVSHHHSDHYGGMDQVIRSFHPSYFVATGSSHTTKTYLKLLQSVRDLGITAVEPTSKPRKIELGTVELTIFPQPPENRAEENDNSIGVRLQYGNFAVLLTGDSETDERRWWLVNNPELIRDCTILKLPHHGSRNGTDTRWLNVVSPELAVASLGRDNEYGHPHSETISLLRRDEIPLLRTDQRGTISIVSDGRTWNLINPQIARRQGSDDAETVAASGNGQDSPARASQSPTRRK